MIMLVMTTEELDAFEKELLEEVFPDVFQVMEERLESVIEALQPLIDAYSKVIQEIVEILDRWITIRRRATMYFRLRQWHIPRSVADWMAWHVPKRWLPWPSFVEWLVMMY